MIIDLASTTTIAETLWVQERDIIALVALSQVAIRSSREILDRRNQSQLSLPLAWQQQPIIERYDFAMTNSETEVEMVQRHVRQGLAMVARQHEILARLRAANYPTKLAEEVLVNLQTVQMEHEAHLVRITK